MSAGGPHPCGESSFCREELEYSLESDMGKYKDWSTSVQSHIMNLPEANQLICYSVSPVVLRGTGNCVRNKQIINVIKICGLSSHPKVIMTFVNIFPFSISAESPLK